MNLAAGNGVVDLGPDDRLSKLCNEVRNMICEELDEQSLARLGSTSRLWSQYVHPLVYRKNATEGSSSAIIWAAKESLTGAGLDLNTRVLRHAIDHGGDVNAVHQGARDDETSTALHYAAAQGRSAIVKQLLEAGADVHALASGFRIFREEGMLETNTGGELARHGPALLFELKRTKWLPLLLPLLRGHRRVVKLLHDAGATPLLAVRREPGGDHGVTAFHLFATMSDEEYLGGDMGNIHNRIWARGCQDYINMTTELDGLAPLHLSLEFPNHAMLNRLLASADVDVRSELGRTPLMHAINLCTEATEPQRRKFLIEAVRALIEHNADVDATSHIVLGESPLVCAILADADDWGRAFRDLKTLLVILVSKGANVNGNGEGPSIIQSLCDKIRQRGGNNSLEALLDILMAGGGNINMAVSAESRSILFEFIRKYNDVPKKFFKKLVTQYGATLKPAEASAALYSWVRCPKLRSASYGYDVLKLHKQHISAAAFDYAWRQAFETEDKDLVRRLVADGPPPENAARLLAIVLKRPRHSLWAYAKDLDFDANYVDPNEGTTFLHMIVRKLRVRAGREKQAMREASFFIARGMSVCIKDKNGLTALQRLRRLHQPFAQLRLLIHEAKDRERGEY